MPECVAAFWHPLACRSMLFVICQRVCLTIHGNDEQSPALAQSHFSRPMNRRDDLTSTVYTSDSAPNTAPDTAHKGALHRPHRARRQRRLHRVVGTARSLGRCSRRNLRVLPRVHRRDGARSIFAPVTPHAHAFHPGRAHRTARRLADGGVDRRSGRTFTLTLPRAGNSTAGSPG